MNRLVPALENSEIANLGHKKLFVILAQCSITNSYTRRRSVFAHHDFFLTGVNLGAIMANINYQDFNKQGVRSWLTTKNSG
jgi:hypothetical protein